MAAPWAPQGGWPQPAQQQRFAVAQQQAPPPRAREASPLLDFEPTPIGELEAGVAPAEGAERLHDDDGFLDMLASLDEGGGGAAAVTQDAGRAAAAAEPPSQAAQPTAPRAPAACVAGLQAHVASMRELCLEKSAALQRAQVRAPCSRCMAKACRASTVPRDDLRRVQKEVAVWLKVLAAPAESACVFTADALARLARSDLPRNAQRALQHSGAVVDKLNEVIAALAVRPRPAPS